MALRYKAWPRVEGYFLFFAGVAEPVPVKGRLASDDHVGAVGLELFEQFFRLAGLEVAVQQFFAALVDNTSIHFIGVKVDSAVEWVLSLIKIHHGLLGWGGTV